MLHWDKGVKLQVIENKSNLMKEYISLIHKQNLSQTVMTVTACTPCYEGTMNNTELKNEHYLLYQETKMSDVWWMGMAMCFYLMGNRLNRSSVCCNVSLAALCTCKERTEPSSYWFTGPLIFQLIHVYYLWIMTKKYDPRYTWTKELPLFWAHL